MSLKLRRNSSLLSAIACILFCSTLASGDILFGRDSVKYGKITEITKDGVYIAEGCDHQKIKQIQWVEIRTLRIDNECTIPETIGPIGGISSDTCSDGPNQIVYVVSFGKDKAYASSIASENGNLIVNMVNDKGTIRGPLNRVRLISRINICSRYIPKEFKWPSEFRLD